MAKNRPWVFAAIAFVLGVWIANAQNNSSEGAKPYVPTRTEWLALRMQANEHADLENSKFSIGYVPQESDTIVLYVGYLPSVERELMNHRIEYAKEELMVLAKNYGWNSWLKIREEVHMSK